MRRIWPIIAIIVVVNLWALFYFVLHAGPLIHVLLLIALILCFVGFIVNIPEPPENF